MANTVTEQGATIEISAIDSDYDAAEVMAIHSIKLYPGAADDLCRIFNAAVTSVEFCKLQSSDGDPRIEYFDGMRFNPVLDFSESTLSANSKVVIIRADR